jgi:hypothetical protein
MLVENGVIQQPSTGTSPAYELTELGEQLRKPVISLGFWGLALPVDERIDWSSARAELIALCLTGSNDAAASAGLQETYEFQVGTEVFHTLVDNGTLLARSGPSAAPVALRVQCDIDTFIALVLGEISPSRALRERRAALLQGDQPTFTRAFKVLAYKP